MRCCWQASSALLRQSKLLCPVTALTAAGFFPTGRKMNAKTIHNGPGNARISAL